MKITRNLLNEINIFNPYNLAEKVGNKIFIDYAPADNGRLTAHYAYWKTYRLDFLRPENKSKEGTKKFTVTCREEKDKQLQIAIAWVKKFYNIDITEKDVFGAWHQTGTMAKLESLLKEVKTNDN